MSAMSRMKGQKKDTSSASSCAACRVHHALHVMAGIVVELHAVLILKQSRIALHRAQRHAQIVRNRVAERFQLLVDRLQLVRALRDALLELFVQREYLQRGPFLCRDVGEHAIPVHRAVGTVADGCLSADPAPRAVFAAYECLEGPRLPRALGAEH
jgi:hypothetical protein